MKLSRQQALILDALHQHSEGCETDRRGTCMRHMVKCGYRYTERVRELRQKGFPIEAVRVGQGHFHYFHGAQSPHLGAASAPAPMSLEAPKSGQSEMFKTRRVGNVVFEKSGT